MNKYLYNGFVFSLDAAISLIIISVIIAITIVSLSYVEQPTIEELLIMQKEHDLMKHWLVTDASEQEMVEQLQELFGNEGVKLEVDGITIFYRENNNTKKAISSRLVIFDKELNAREIVLTVFN
jgi:DNA/RNA endonuclease YhcR with UshA esterase domain